MPPKQDRLGTRTIGVKKIRTSHLNPNPYNPRMLFDDLPRATLRDSIRKVGILVPLTVYWDRDRKQHVILDGQRRWMCANDLGLRTVPVNQVAPPDLIQNIVTMFQIHKLREDWELMPTALKVELLMNEIHDRNNGHLAELTGLDEAVIVRCKKLISYDKSFQDLMLDPNPEKRIKPDFFIEMYVVIEDRDVKQFDWFQKRTFVRQMLKKYLEEPKAIKAVTDFRRIKQYITSARRIDALVEFSKRLQKFTEDPHSPIDSLEIQEASTHQEAIGISRLAAELEQSVRGIDIDEFYGEAGLWAALKALAEIIDAKLRAANDRHN